MIIVLFPVIVVLESELHIISRFFIKVAIRGIGEKFALTPVAGTASMTLPVFSRNEK